MQKYKKIDKQHIHKYNLNTATAKMMMLQGHFEWRFTLLACERVILKERLGEAKVAIEGTPVQL